MTTGVKVAIFLTIFIVILAIIIGVSIYMVKKDRIK